MKRLTLFIFILFYFATAKAQIPVSQYQSFQNTLNSESPISAGLDFTKNFSQAVRTCGSFAAELALRSVLSVDLSHYNQNFDLPSLREKVLKASQSLANSKCDVDAAMRSVLAALVVAERGGATVKKAIISLRNSNVGQKVNLSIGIKFGEIIKSEGPNAECIKLVKKIIANSQVREKNEPFISQNYVLGDGDFNSETGTFRVFFTDNDLASGVATSLFYFRTEVTGVIGDSTGEVKVTGITQKPGDTTVQCTVTSKALLNF